uniref:Uncharacterized protein n=1 Tax=Arundo donax TaxID=35708 RepID=A0A0A9D8F7_ARUDO
MLRRYTSSGWSPRPTPAGSRWDVGDRNLSTILWMTSSFCVAPGGLEVSTATSLSSKSSGSWFSSMSMSRRM